MSTADVLIHIQILDKTFPEKRQKKRTSPQARALLKEETSPIFHILKE